MFTEFQHTSRLKAAGLVLPVKLAIDFVSTHQPPEGGCAVQYRHCFGVQCCMFQHTSRLKAAAPTANRTAIPMAFQHTSRLKAAAPLLRGAVEKTMFQHTSRLKAAGQNGVC